MEKSSSLMVSRDSGALVTALVFLLPLSLALNAYLGWELHRMAGVVIAQRRPARPPIPRRVGLPLGTVLPALSGTHIDGSDAVVNYRGSGKPALVYVMSPKCGWCRRNRANLDTLVRSTSGSYRVVCVSLLSVGLEEYVAHSGLPSNVEFVANVPADLMKAYGFGPTPELLAVSADGRLAGEWEGALQGASQSEVERFFKVKLPGLVAN